jgi:hypothetical protein
MSNYLRTNEAAGTHVEMHYVPAPFRTNSLNCYVVRITDLESGDTIYARHFADHTAAYSYFLRSAEPPQSRRIDSPTFLPVIR